MPVSMTDVKSNNKRIEIYTGKMGYFFHNFIRYKIFLSATYEMVLLYCVFVIWQTTCGDEF
jgi:hypothetical protein